MVTTRLRQTATLLVLAVVAGCAHEGRFASPTEGGQAWLEVASPHFLFRTDLPSGVAASVLRRLESDRALLLEAMPSLSAVQGRLEVIAYSSREDYWKATGIREDFAGHLMMDQLGGQRVLMGVSPGGVAEDQAVGLAHEIAHALTYHVVPQQPRWFAEGLATYLSSVARDKNGKRAVGETPSDWLVYEDLVPVHDLFKWIQASEGLEGRLYATAWVLVRQVATEDPQGLADYQRRLTAGEEPTRAWNGAFPRWRLDESGGQKELDRILAARQQDRLGFAREVSATVDPELAERTLSQSEVYTLRLTMGMAWPRERLEKEVAEALALDPGHVAALEWRAEWNRAEGVALARRAIAAHPGDARAWAMLGRALARTEAPRREMESAWRKAVELDPTSQNLLGLAASVVSTAPAEAEDLAFRAVGLAPWSPVAHSIRAEALVAIGGCAEARHQAVLAQRFADDPDDRAWSSLQQYVERSCNPAAVRVDDLVRKAAREREAGRDEAALQLLAQACTLEPKHPDAWFQRGRILLALGRNEEALSAFHRQTEIDPRHDQAWSGAGTALERLGRPEEAVAAYRRQAEISPRDAHPHLHLGWTLLSMGRAREAITELERADALDSSGPAAQLALGRARLKLDQPRQAVEAFETALKRSRDPLTLDDAAGALAHAAVELERADAWAEEALQRLAERLRAADLDRVGSGEVDASLLVIDTWEILGWVRYQQGRLPEAERYTVATQQAHPDAEAAYHEGQILERMRRTQDAAAAYARSLAMNPKGAEPMARLTALVGKNGVDGQVARARDELAGRRYLRVGSGPFQAPDAPLLLVLASDGKVVRVRFADGSMISAEAAKLRGLPHGIAFPDAATPFLVVKSRFRCTSGSCTARIE